MNSQAEFRIVSIIMLLRGAIEAFSIGLALSGVASPLSSGIAFLLTIAEMCAITLAYLYCGVMGLRYCNGTGKGTLHIKPAIIGLILEAILAAFAIFNMIIGKGAMDLVFIIIFDVFVIHWYFSMAKKNLA